MAYGTPEGVAALAGVWTDDGEWLDADAYQHGTTPTLTEIERWLVQVSAQVNTALKNAGFKTPVTHEETLDALSLFVEGFVADLADRRNSKGRFMSDKVINGGNTPMMILLSDFADWILVNAGGLEVDTERSATNTAEIGTKDNFPIFVREGFGNRFEDWTRSNR